MKYLHDDLYISFISQKNKNFYHSAYFYYKSYIFSVLRLRINRLIGIKHLESFGWSNVSVIQPVTILKLLIELSLKFLKCYFQGEEEMEESDGDENESDENESGTEDVVPEIESSTSEEVKGILKKTENSSIEKNVKFNEIADATSEKKGPNKKKDILEFIKQSIDEVKKEKKSKGEEEKEDMEEDSELEEEEDLGSEEEDLSGSDSENEEVEGEGDEDEEGEDVDEEESEEEEGQENEVENSDEEEEGDEEIDEEEEGEEGDSFDEDMSESSSKKKKDKEDEYKEDIYGRLRDKQGNLITEKKTTSGAYVPPGKRLQMASSLDAKKKLEIERLKRQLKGLVNR